MDMRENGDTFVPVGAKEKKDHCHLGSESICRQDDIHIHRLTATDRAHNGQPFQANVMKKNLLRSKKDGLRGCVTGKQYDWRREKQD